MDSQDFMPVQQKEFAATLAKIIKTGETGIILLPPNTGKSNWLINNIIDYINGKDPLKIVKIDLNFYEIEDIEDFQLELQKELEISKRKKVTFIINNAHILIANKNYLLLNKINELTQKIPNLQIIFFFNTDVTHPEIAKHIKTNIFANIVYFPLYESHDVRAFIKEELLKKWSMKLSERQVDNIVEQCGGYFWLVKQAVRGLRDNPRLEVENLSTLEGVKLALEQFYAVLLESERNVLESLILGRKSERDLEKHSFEYLKGIGLIKNGEVTIPLLVSYVRQYMPKMSVEVKDNLIFINFVNVDSHFSKKEKKVFKALINSKGKAVSRDEIAKAIWPINTEDFYSDWAVDRLVARLRTKIIKLGIPKEVIRTIRNQGYTLED